MDEVNIFPMLDTNCNVNTAVKELNDKTNITSMKFENSSTFNATLQKTELSAVVVVQLKLYIKYKQNNK